jgi:hypothetical protein
MQYWIISVIAISFLVWLFKRFVRVSSHKDFHDKRARSMFNGFMKGRYKC